MLPKYSKAAWFNYLDEFFDQCFIRDNTAFKYYNKDCSNSILTTYIPSLSQDSIDSCISNSFSTPNDYSTDNSLLA